jgi:hypothetical protein
MSDYRVALKTVNFFNIGNPDRFILMDGLNNSSRPDRYLTAMIIAIAIVHMFCWPQNALD